MRSEKASFMKKHKNIENSLNLAQKYTEPLVFSCYKSKDNVESPPAPTTIITDPETRPSTAGSTQKLEKTPLFTPKTQEPCVSTHFSWADEAAELPTLPTAPTKQPRDLSDLRSSSKNSFSSLQRRYHKFNKKRFHFINSTPQYHCHHMFPGPYHHFQNFRQHSQPPFSASLNWDQDPRLSDLNNALKALGWVRR
jgi:hypothetical protein